MQTLHGQPGNSARRKYTTAGRKKILRVLFPTLFITVGTAFISIAAYRFFPVDPPRDLSRAAGGRDL